MPLLPNLLDDWKSHRCLPGDDPLLPLERRIARGPHGDCAAIVPFYGQGMNSGMKIAPCWTPCLRGRQLDRIMARYTELRKPAGAILELACRTTSKCATDGRSRFPTTKEARGAFAVKAPRPLAPAVLASDVQPHALPRSPGTWAATTEGHGNHHGGTGTMESLRRRPLDGRRAPGTRIAASRRRVTRYAHASLTWALLALSFAAWGQGVWDSWSRRCAHERSVDVVRRHQHGHGHAL